ncbi:sugar phosphate isomerase/epimerase [Candidatus Nitrosopelagicus sp.]|nr:sugar phosphate isomerase/epimerase [Candidatus Nitrosopelagicus sp.]
MKTGFSTNAFTKFSLLETIEIISDVGYDGLEIVADTPHAFLPLSNEKLKQIKSSLENRKLLVSNINANTVLGWNLENGNDEKFEPSLSNKNETLRKWRVEYTKKAIEVAAELSAPSVCITSGIKNTEIFENEMTQINKSLSEILEFAEKNSILICMEYEPGLLIEKSHDVFEVSKNFKNLGLNLDTCHVAVLNENFSKVIHKFKDKIFHTHISDCKNSIHYHLIPGYGEIDFVKIYSNLKEINYDGFLTAELYTYAEKPREAASETFIFLNNLIHN